MKTTLASQLYRLNWTLSLAVVAAFAACTSRPPLAVLPSAEVDSVVVRRLVARSNPVGPHRATFAWTLDEAGERFSGRGIARYEAPSRIRLDLFGPRGETYLAAALVGDSVRLPPQASGDFSLPSAPLLWGALGVTRPPAGGRATGLGATGEDTTVQFAAGGNETWEYRIGDAGLVSLSRGVGGNALETVEITRGEAGRLRSARYRNWSAFRTLDLVFDTVDEAEPFPPSIWLETSAQQ